MIDLDRVTSFGEIDADADPLLERCFESHEAYIEARSHSKTIILGRKGSGKSAIFRKFEKLDEPNVYTYGHGFSEYPWHHHAKQKQIGVPEEQCFTHSWEYLIYISLAKIILSRGIDQPWSYEAIDDTVALDTFIEDTYGTRDPDLAQVFSPVRSIRLKGELALNLGPVSGKLGAEGIPMDHLPTIIAEVNRNLLKAILNCANPDHSYFICFDELDLGFSLNSSEYQNQLIGLLLAARKINNKAKSAGKNISVVVFLRDDIYQMLHFEDKNKITESLISIIQWDLKKNGPSLKSLMKKDFI